MSKKFKLRKACPEDSRALTSLHQAAFGQGWDQEFFQEFLRENTAHGIICEKKGILAGFVLFRNILEEAEIITLAVHPNHRNRGIGTHLISAVLEDCAQKGVHKIFLEVAMGNSHALKIYEKKGFKMISTREKYYISSSKEREDALVLEYKNN